MDICTPLMCIIVISFICIISCMFICWKIEINKSKKQKEAILKLKELIDRYENNPLYMQIHGENTIIGYAVNSSIGSQLNEILSNYSKEIKK